MARVQGKVRAYVLFLKPGGTAANWEDSDLRRSAAAIPGVTTLIDVDGAEARRFGAQTSGHILLFDPAGRLLFSGGITESRGHAGGNVGESSIESLINDEKTGPRSTVVFGCPLFERTRKGKDSLCRN
jgi:hypothetical protein